MARTGVVIVKNKSGFARWIEAEMDALPGSNKAGQIGKFLGGLAVATINKYRNCDTENLSLTIVDNIAAYLGCTQKEVRDWLENDGASPPVRRKRTATVAPIAPTVSKRIETVIPLITRLKPLSDSEIVRILEAAILPEGGVDTIKNDRLGLPAKWLETIDIFHGLPDDLKKWAYHGKVGEDLERFKRVLEREEYPVTDDLVALYFVFSTRNVKVPLEYLEMVALLGLEQEGIETASESLLSV